MKDELDFCSELKLRLNHGFDDAIFAVEGELADPDWQRAALFGYAAIRVSLEADDIFKVESYIAACITDFLFEKGYSVWNGSHFIVCNPGGDLLSMDRGLRGKANASRFTFSRLPDQIEQISIDHDNYLVTSGTALNGNPFKERFYPLEPGSSAECKPTSFNANWRADREQANMRGKELLSDLNKLHNQSNEEVDVTPTEQDASEGTPLHNYLARKAVFEKLFGAWPDLVCPLPQLHLSCPGLAIIPYASTLLGYSNLAFSFGLAGIRAGTGLDQTIVEQVVRGNTISTVMRITEGPVVSKGLTLPGFGFELIAICQEHVEIAMAGIQWGIHAHLDEKRDVLTTVIEDGGLIVGPYAVRNGRSTYYLIAQPWEKLPTEVAFGEQRIRFFVCVSIHAEETAFARREGIGKLLYQLQIKKIAPTIDLHRASVV